MGGTIWAGRNTTWGVTNEVSAESIRQASATLNRPIALQETVNSLKIERNRKSVGIDNIANEILKVQIIQDCLHFLFVSCFEYVMVPRIWLPGIIHPILKKERINYFPPTIAVLAWCQPYVERSVQSSITRLFSILESMDCSWMSKMVFDDFDAHV